MLKKTFLKEALSVRVYDTRDDMGKNAAADAAAEINRVIRERGEANVISKSSGWIREKSVKNW